MDIFDRKSKIQLFPSSAGLAMDDIVKYVK